MPKSPKWDTSLTPAANARAALSRMVPQYFAAGRHLAQAHGSARDLHRFRIRGKRLRYTLEILAPLYGAEAGKCLEQLRKAQSYLGDLNDCVMAARLLRRLPSPPADRRRARIFLEQRAAELRAAFVRFWKSEMDSTVEALWLASFAKPRSEPAGSATRSRRKSRK